MWRSGLLNRKDRDNKRYDRQEWAKKEDERQYFVGGAPCFQLSRLVFLVVVDIASDKCNTGNQEERDCRTSKQMDKNENGIQMRLAIPGDLRVIVVCHDSRLSTNVEIEDPLVAANHCGHIRVPQIWL